MIRGLIFLALWAASPTPGQVGSTALYTDFESRPAPAVVEALREELDSLMAPDGLRFAWKSLPATDQSVWMELAVVKFSGRCEVLPFAGNSKTDARLGWTHISDGVVLPFAQVDCDAIRLFILKGLYGLPPQSRERVYGRAVGRVLAHELLHIFAKTASHGSHGVDQPTLTAPDLLCEHLVFDDHKPAVHMLRTNQMSIPAARPGSAQAGRDAYVRDGCGSCHGARGEGTRHGPALRAAGSFVDSVVLAAKLTKSETKMSQRARNLKVAAPSVAEDDISGLVRFLNETGR